MLWIKCVDIPAAFLIELNQNMPKENIDSIEKLAVLTQGEFLRIEKKMDEKFERVDDVLQTVVDTLDLVRADIHDVKIALGPMVRSVAALEETVRVLDKRVGRLEEKAGLKFVPS